MGGRGEAELLFGDIHNHNACGYGLGSMARTIDIARTHLDFFAFTGHSSWHDMEPMEGRREQHWIKGFARLAEAWPEVQGLIADANRDPDFTAFLGFEWHSSHFGDQCVVLPEDYRPICYAKDVEELRRFCLAEDGLMIPHHLAYPQGHRGVNWQVFKEDCTPVVEIFSEHGNSEEDRGAFPFFSHSMGGRQTSQTVRAALKEGLRFGFTASSDTHSGFPGAYGEGLMSVLAEGRDRRSIMKAIRQRRTCALTGDRIEVDFVVDGAPLGSDIEAGREIEVSWDVRGRDEMDVVELIHNGHVVHRDHPVTDVPHAVATGAPFQLRFEWGWGPWGDLALARVCDWAFAIAVENGRLLRAFPCLQSGPFDEDRRHRIRQDGDRLDIVSYSGRDGAYRENPNQSIVLELQGDASTMLDLAMSRPAPLHDRRGVGALLKGSAFLPTGPFPKESAQWHRIVPMASSRVRGSVRLPVPEGRSQIYLRARQQNGQMAWASPVFVNYR